MAPTLGCWPCRDNRSSADRAAPSGVPHRVRETARIARGRRRPVAPLIMEAAEAALIGCNPSQNLKRKREPERRTLFRAFPGLLSSRNQPSGRAMGGGRVASSAGQNFILIKTLDASYGPRH
jgi:hypothetical protein